MKIAIFSAQSFELEFLKKANQDYGFDLTYFDVQLNPATVAMAHGFSVVSCFVTDKINSEVLKILNLQGVKLVALRSAGFNHVDLAAADQYNIAVCRVPAYSPYAVAEFTVGLLLCLNRKIHRAFNRVRENNFSLHGFLGFDLYEKTVGVIGTGKIGRIFCKIMRGFGAKILAYDIHPNPDCVKQGVIYTDLPSLYSQSDVISLHCPLTQATQHLINAQALALMKPGVLLINTGRGGLIDTRAVIDALKVKKVGGLGIDVYEEEESLLFHDFSTEIIEDDVIAYLHNLPNVLMTGHQAFFTHEALSQIAAITLRNVQNFKDGILSNTVSIRDK